MADPDTHPVLHETKVALQTAGKAETPLAYMAYKLARSIDELAPNMVTMLPALVRELRLTLNEALPAEDDNRVGDALTELLAKMGSPGTK